MAKALVARCKRDMMASSCNPGVLTRRKGETREFLGAQRPVSQAYALETKSLGLKVEGQD